MTSAFVCDKLNYIIVKRAALVVFFLSYSLSVFLWPHVDYINLLCLLSGWCLVLGWLHTAGLSQPLLEKAAAGKKSRLERSCRFASTSDPFHVKSLRDHYLHKKILIRALNILF